MAARHNALIVDDSGSMRKLVCLTLHRIDFATVEASNGIEALVHARNIKPLDLVIADLNMPVMDGIKLISQMRKTPGLTMVPVLLLTTESNAADKDRARHAGASGWLTKPFDPEQLIAAVQTILAR